ncbi:MAG: YgcG family protein [Vicinamibacterales bacterium]
MVDVVTARGRAVTTVLAAALTATALTAAAQPPPPALTAPVNDFAGVVDAESAAALDRLIRDLRGASGDTVVVATVKTVQPWGDVRTYATAMFENGGRGIGERGKDNGLLLLLAVEDRQVWVEVGYDLEGIVTDGFAGETSRQVMAPYFRQGQYGQGLLAGTSRLVERIAADRNVTVTGIRVSAPPEPVRDPVSVDWVVLLFVVLFVILPLVNRRGRRRRRGWRGGVGPWGGGYYGGTWGGGSSWGGSSGGFGGFGGGRSGGGGGGASW